MNRRTKEQWQALFEAHEKSGLSATAFCKEHSLNPKYFSLRRKQLHSVASQEGRAPFVRVEPLTNLVDTHQIKLNGSYGELLLPDSLSPEWVAALLKQLA